MCRLRRRRIGVVLLLSGWLAACGAGDSTPPAGVELPEVRSTTASRALEDGVATRGSDAVDTDAPPDATGSASSGGDAALASPGGSGPVVILGDSITWESDEEVRRTLAGCSDQPVVVDAVPGRHAVQGITLFGEYRSSAVEAMGALEATGVDARTWIVQIGTNDLDTLTGPQEAHQLIGAILEHTDGTDRVVWLTVRHDFHPVATQVWNDALHATAGLEVVAWTPGTDGLRDGIHPTPLGRQHLADLYCRTVDPTSRSAD